MRITSFTDYGLRTLIYLACLPKDELSSVPKVSQVYKVSQNHMVKVIGQLKKLGYIEALRGKGGGIRLAVSPEQVRIGRVMRELEPHTDGVDCLSSPCVLLPKCKLKAALAEAMESFFSTMDQYTLADLVENKEVASQILIQMSGDE
ncbi:Rrf2 family transcriptional regulator [Vibrio chagasii]|uniref:Rrf2 family transcriptional regulator n=1 Tax=Vibrio chagasii TaxID=170679 RepID=UPI0035A6F89C